MSSLKNTDEWSGKLKGKPQLNTEQWSAVTNKAYAIDTKSLMLDKATKHRLNEKAKNIQRLKDELGGLVDKGAIKLEDAEKKIAEAISQEYVASKRFVNKRMSSGGFRKPLLVGAVIIGGYYLYKKLILRK